MSTPQSGWPPGEDPFTKAGGQPADPGFGAPPSPPPLPDIPGGYSGFPGGDGGLPIGGAAKSHAFHPAHPAPARFPLGAVLAGAGALVAVLAVMVFFVFAGGGLSADEQRWLPDNATMAVRVDGRRLFDSEVWKKQKSANGAAFDEASAEMRSAIGFGFEQIDSVIFGGTGNPTAGGSMVAAIKLNADMDAGKLAAELKKAKLGPKVVEEKLGTLPFFVRGEMGVLIVNPRTVVFGSTDAVRKVHQRNGPAKISEGLASAAKLMRPGVLSFAMDGKAMNELAEAAGAGKGPMPFDPRQIAAVAMSLDVTSEISIDSRVRFTDSKSAEGVEGMFNGFLGMARSMADGKQGGMPPAAKKALDSLKLSRSGDTLTVTVSLPSDIMDGAGSLVGPGLADLLPVPRSESVPRKGTSTSPSKSTKPSTKPIESAPRPLPPG